MLLYYWFQLYPLDIRLKRSTNVIILTTNTKTLGGNIASEGQKLINHCFVIGFNSTPSDEGECKINTIGITNLARTNVRVSINTTKCSSTFSWLVGAYAKPWT